jgi:spore germination protein YaaH
MKSYLLLLTFLLAHLLTSNAQSIHEEEYLRYKQTGISAEEYERTNQAAHVTDTRSGSNCNLNKIVFGWHPYWQNGFETNYQWDLLSHLCYFSYDVNYLNGNAVTTNSWSTANVVTQALANNVKVSLCVTLFDDHAAFFGNSSAKQTLITNLISLVQQRGAHGVNIDFEAVPSAQSANLTAFMLDLCNQFHTAIPNGEVSIALPSVDWSNTFDVAAMSSCVDQFFIMGYDYYYGGSAQAGPTDPLYSMVSSYNYNHAKSITYYLNRGVPANKLCLGLPYYGREWETESNAIPSNTTGNYSGTRTYKYVRDNSGTYTNHQYHAGSKSGYFTYQNGGNWRQCFINSSYTLGKRFEMVHLRGLAGIGIWALGYDDGYSDFWNQIEEKFTDCYAPACNDTLYDMGGPSQNYYDNEHYTYTISPANASTIDLIFFSFSTEANYDTLWLYDGSSTAAPLIGAYTGTNSPGNFTTSTGSITLKFKSDVSTNSFGFRAYYYCNEMVTDVTLSVVEGLKVYPNPAEDVLTVECSGEIKEVKIYDATGKAVASPLTPLQGERGTVDVSQLSSGIYNLCIFTDKGMLTKKIIISRK